MDRVPRGRFWCFALLVAAALAWDLVSKAWVFSALGGPHRSTGWWWRSRFLWGRFDFRLTTHFNEGALFGFGQGWGWLFALLSMAAACGIVYWLFVRGQARSWWLTICLGLVMAGALGNLYDRLHLHGSVTASGRPQYGVRDFLDCRIPWIEFQGLAPRLVAERDWPVFNFADVYLVTGSLLLVVYSFVVPQHESQPQAGGPKPPSSRESAAATAACSAAQSSGT